MGQEKSLPSFLTKPALCLAWVITYENWGHGLSGEEARQRGKGYGERKRKHWISSGTGFQARSESGTGSQWRTHGSVHDIATETVAIVMKFPFFGQSWFSLSKIPQLITLSIFKVFWQNFARLLSNYSELFHVNFVKIGSD